MREAEHDRQQPGAGQHGAGPVHSRPAGRPSAADVGKGAGHGDRGEHQVDVQTPAPREVLGKDPAQDQADGAAAGRHRAENAEGPGPFARVIECAHQGAQGGRREHSAEHPLQRPGRDQDDERAGGAADRRGNGESDQARDEHPLAAEHVTQPSAHQQQAAERQRVRRHDPLPVAVGEAQRLLGGRQRDVHDRPVQHHHQLGERNDDKDQPAPVQSGLILGDTARTGSTQLPLLCDLTRSLLIAPRSATNETDQTEWTRIGEYPSCACTKSDARSSAAPASSRSPA
jgi:hypothetical protein